MKTKAFIHILCLTALALVGRAEDLYVRAGLSSGSHTGADWNNAWSSFSQVLWGTGAGRVGPGDTLWIAGGTYTGNLVVGASGAAGSPIQIKRVLASDAVPASAAGWSSSFDSQVVISTGGSCIYMDNGIGSYVTIDGRVPSGIKVNYVNGGRGVEMNGGTNFTDVAFRYIEAAGPGPVTQVDDTRGFDLTTQAGLNNLTVSHCEAHHSDTLIQVTRNTGMVIEYCDFHHAGAINAATYHPNTIYLGATVNGTIRYNKLHEIDVEGLFFGDAGSDTVAIYGNQFYQGSSAKNSGRGIEFDNSASTRNILVYNNTFVDLPLAGVSFANGQSHPGAEVKNNIFFNNSPNFGPAAHDYNYMSASNSEPNGIGNGTAPFVNAAAYDYHIVSTIASNKPRNEGVNLGSAYSVDRDGVVRGADGAWDMGAYEYNAGGTPPPTNTPPTISSISNQTTPTGTAVGPISFTIGDAETAAGSLTLSGSSSNATLVPNANITFGGSGASRTVTVTPAAGQTGTSTITVTVSDGAATTSTNFSVTVNSTGNAAPTISNISDQSTTTNNAVGPIAFTIGDAETAAGSLTLSAASNNTTLVPNANITFGGSGGSRTVTVTPAANATGSATITVTVSDGTSTASDSFAVLVSAPAQPGSGLVAAYGFSENSGSVVTDASGNGNNGQISGATWTSSGRYGSALSFNGSNSLVVVNSSASLNLSTAMTIEAWANPSASMTGWRTLVQKEVDAYMLHASSNTAMRPAGGGTFNGAVSFATSGTSIGVGAWTHVAMTYDGATIRIYMNGTQVASQAQTGPIQNTGTPLRIGGNVPYGEYFQGLIDEVRVYNRALSAAEIQSDMNTPVNAVVTPPANTAPTISAISNQTTTTGTAVGPIAFTVGDAETAAGSLTVTGSSSNTALVPNTNIVLGGSGANRTVSITPAAGQTGTATVTLTVSDGSLTATRSFTVTVNAPANTAPTISAISNQTTTTGTAVGPIAFTVGDAETAAGSLTVSGSSSNTTLVPNANIALGGTGANRTVTVTPAAGQTGTATITLTVSDGSLTANRNFTVTVNAPPNTAPTISAITNQTTTTGTAVGPIAFTVGDAETAAGSLTLTGASSNTTLVPNSGITFGGSGANRTVTVTPASGQTGTSTITVTVSDGSLTANRSFAVTVNAPANTAPTISSIANQTTTTATAVGPIAFTVGDAETAAGSLTVSGSSSNTTLVPNANIALGGSGASRTVTVTPAANQTGTATIKLTVSDGSLTASQSFTVTVNAPPNTAPTISAIPDQMITANTPTGAVAFTVGDAETAAASLTLSGSSSNTTLVPNANIAFGGSGANRTVTVTPATDQTGSAVITVAVSDGTTSSTRSFTVNVSAPANSAPTISSIGDQTIDQGGTAGPIAFTIGDKETDAASLTLTASSSDTSLVPTASITFGGSSANRTVTVTPAADKSGTAVITITVGDGKLTTSTSFNLVVNASPTTPGLVAAYSFNENTGTAANDASGNGNNGELRGATWTTAGKYGAALSFNGSSSLVFVPSSASLKLGTAMTLEAWAYPAANQSGWRTIVQKEVDSYFLHASNSSGNLRPAGGGTFGGKMNYTASPSAIPTKTWTHLAVTYDGATIRLYVNGTQVSSKAQTGAIEANNNGLRIGGNVPYGEYFQGIIDEVRVYNRPLTAAEIKTDMQTPVASAPAPAAAWSHADIGSVGVAGSDNGNPDSTTISVTGSGADIWGTDDGFRYLYRPLRGDGVIEARVDSITNTDAWAKAGVMIRESLAANARNVYAFVTPGYGVRSQVRSSTGGSTTSVGTNGTSVPSWVRLVRTGDTIVASMSTDGTNWTTVSTQTVSMTADVYVGFAVTAHNNTVLATGVFSEPFVQ